MPTSRDPLPSGKGGPKEPAEKPELTPDDVWLHFALQVIVVRQKSDPAALKARLNGRIGVRELRECTRLLADGDRRDLDKKRTEQKIDDESAVPYNRKLASFEPLSAELLDKFTKASQVRSPEFVAITPPHFLQNHPDSTLGLLVSFQLSTDFVPNLWNYYNKLLELEFSLDLLSRPALLAKLGGLVRDPVPSPIDGPPRLPGEAPSGAEGASKDKTVPELLAELKALNGQPEFIDEVGRSFEIIDKKIAAEKFLPAVTASTDSESLLAHIFLTAKKSFGYCARPAQVLSVLLFTHKPPGQGRLVQINTGEGKTLIIAVLAAFHALRKSRVDVVTSSDNLAERDAAASAGFFGALGLRVGSNINFYQKFRAGPGAENVYASCDVLYGTPHQFAADLLWNLKSKEKFYRRGQEFLIVDEVDNMLIDCNSFITKLSNAGAGFERLQLVRQKIWNFVVGLAAVRGGQPGPGLREVVLAQIRGGRAGFGLNEFQGRVFDQFVELWVEGAISACFVLREDQDYILREERGVRKVVVVDSENTGELMLNMRWQHGVHDFLEQKHNLPPRSEGLVSLFYSNLRFFTNYGPNLCGLTGTLGSEACRRFLREVYNVDDLLMPTHRPSRYTQRPALLASPADWEAQLVRHVAAVVRDQGRVVLAIVNSIQEAQTIRKMLVAQKVKVILFVYSDEEKLHEKISAMRKPRAIVATNLAGRGTDVGLSPALERLGGLHVVLGFVPQNLRVEKQAFGRTARKGNSGDGIFIVPDVYHGAKFETMEDILRVRDHWESQNMDEHVYKQVRQFQFEDGCFKAFCDKVMALPNILDSAGKLNGLLEQWGEFYFCLQTQFREEPEDKRTARFQEFLAALFEAFARGDYATNYVHCLFEADAQIRHRGDLEQSARDIQKARALAAANYAVFLREAIVHNNRGEYAEAEGSLKKAQDDFQVYVAQRAAGVRARKSTGAANEYLQLTRRLADVRSQHLLPTDEERRQLAPEQLAQKAIERVRAEQPGFGELLLAAEDDPQKLDPAIKDEVAEFGQVADTIQNVLKHNRAQSAKLIIEVNTELGLRLVNPEVPIVFVKDAETGQVALVEKNAGILGYLVGAVAILGGATLAALSLFSVIPGTGLPLIPIGVGLIHVGWKAIIANYKMNQANAYNPTLLLLEVAADTCLKAASVLTGELLDSEALEKPVKELLKELVGIMPNGERLKKGLLDTIGRGIATGGTRRAFASELAQNLTKGQLSSARPGPAEEARMAGEFQLLLERTVVAQLGKITPERIEVFNCKLEPLVQACLRKIAGNPAEKNLRALTLREVYKHEVAPQDRGRDESLLDAFVGTTADKLGAFQRANRPVGEVHEVIDVADFSCLADFELAAQYTKKWNEYLEGQCDPESRKGNFLASVLLKKYNGYFLSQVG